MRLTPEERQRIIEGHAVNTRGEPQQHLKTEAGRKRGADWLPLIGLCALFVIMVAGISLLNSSIEVRSSSSSGSGTSSEAAPEMTKDYVLKGIDAMTSALHDEQTWLAGESLVEITLVVEVFNNGAKLIQKAQAEQLTDEERVKVAVMRKALIARQRKVFPALREKFAPVFRRALTMTDGRVRTLGKRHETIECVASAFSGNTKIEMAHQAIIGSLVSFRFKRAQYKSNDSRDNYGLYAITSPADGDVAIVDAEGTITPVPE